MSSPYSWDFKARDDRGYDTAAVGSFPWPLVAGYDEIHRWMDAGLAVNAAWQVRDVWEALVRFLGTIAVADGLARWSPDDPRRNLALSVLVNPRGMSIGHWTDLLHIAYRRGADGPDGLKQLFFPDRGRGLFETLVGGDEATSFVAWRNRRFGHGVLGKDMGLYARDALHWLGKLHAAFDRGRPVFEALRLESTGPDGRTLSWADASPLSFYHRHVADPEQAPLCKVQLVAPDLAVDLFPLLSVQVCTVCRQWAAFFFDSYKRDRQRAFFLDFLSGHSVQRRQLAELRRWAEEAPAPTSPAADHGSGPAPDPAGAPSRPDFEPPTHLARAVARFMGRRDRGAIVVTGPAGVGKSWGLLHLDHAAMLPAALGLAVPVLKVAVDGYQPWTAGDVTAALRAAAALRPDPLRVPDEPADPVPHARLCGWLSDLMRLNPQCRERLVVVLDGLDELAADSDAPDLLPPGGALPGGCYLVLGTRPRVRPAAAAGLARVRSTPDHVVELAMGPDDPAHRAVLRAYAQKQGYEDVAEELIDRAAGLFLYVFHFCRALRHGVYGRATELPSPAAYYPGFFDHLRGRVGKHLFESCYAEALAMLGAAREPVGVSQLAACGLEPGRARVALADLEDLLAARREPWDSETLYTLGHQAVREFLSTDPWWADRRAAADRRWAEAALRLTGDWAAADPFDPVDAYLVLHLPDHAADHPDLLRRVREDTTFADALARFAAVFFEQRWWDRSRRAAAAAIRLRDHHVTALGRRDLRDRLANARGNHGLALTALGRPGEAVADLEAAVDILGELVRGEGRDDLRADLGWAAMNHGLALAAVGQGAAAMAAYDAGLAALDPLGPAARPDRARLHLNRSTLRANPDRLRDATTAVELLTAAAGAGEHVPPLDLARVHLARAGVLLEFRAFEPACRDYQAAIVMLSPGAGPGSGPGAEVELAGAHYHLGLARLESGDVTGAVDSLTAAVGRLRDLVTRRDCREVAPTLGKALRVRAAALQAAGRPQDVAADLDDAIGLLRELVREGQADPRVDLAAALVSRARIHLRAGEPAGARVLAREAVQLLTRGRGRDDDPGRRAAADGQLAHARRVLRQATISVWLSWLPARLRGAPG